MQLSIPIKSFTHWFMNTMVAIKSLLKQNKGLLYILIIFAGIYSSISFVNHYNFRTYGFDLGIYNNTLYDYSKFQVNDNPVMHKMFNNILSDHLSFYHIAFAPFRYIFGSWTLLLFQILAILFGAVGVYKFVRLYVSASSSIPTIAAIHFLSMWGVFSALAFDYHDNVVGSMFVPWLFVAIESKNRRSIIIWTIIILAAKENMSLWLSFIFAGVYIWKFSTDANRRLYLLLSILSAAYFVVAIKFIMPSVANPDSVYGHLKYEALGNSLTEYVSTLFTRPQYVFSLLFENHGSDPYYNGIKTELHFILLLSGGVALLYRPQFLIMLIPIYVQKLFNNDYGKWGINNHYSIEFVPIITIALIVWILTSARSERLKQRLFFIAMLVCIGASLAVIMERTSKWYDSRHLKFWDKNHYTQNFDVKKVYSLLADIPPDAKVCAQNPLVPHLAFRERIYTYPYIRDAEYIALLPLHKTTYPQSKESYEQTIQSLRADTTYTLLHDTPDLILFKRHD